jgi:hypothetical protein
MTTKEFIYKSEKFEKEFIKKVYGIVTEYAGAVLRARISDRVAMHETNSKGGKFSTYSKKPTLSSGTTILGKHVWRYYTGTKGRKKAMEWRTVKGRHLFIVPGGYAEIRRLSGRLNTNKNYFLTGDMWEGFGIRNRKLLPNGFKITMGGTTADTKKKRGAQKKINWNSEREGISIIDANKQEEKELIEFVDICMQQELNKIFK